MAKNITELKLKEVQNVTGGYGVVAQSSLPQPQLPTRAPMPTSWPAPTVQSR